MTILLSSHLLAEVQEVCNRVAVITNGRIVHEGALADLTAASSYRLQPTDAARAADAIERIDGIRDLRREHDELVFTLAGDVTIELTRALADAGVGMRPLVREQATLEDLFFRLTAGAEVDEREAAFA